MAHAHSEMPYFINPSVALSDDQKHEKYIQAIAELDGLLAGETDVVLKMVSINCILKTNLQINFIAMVYEMSSEL